MVSRRGFFKLGLAGALTLAAAGAWYRLRAPRTPPAFALTAEQRSLLAALAPALLAGALPNDSGRAAAIARVVAGVEQAIAQLGATAQGQVGDLLSLLVFAPARVLLARVNTPWYAADVEEVALFLERWRASRFQLFQQGYHALHDLVLGVWYADARAWPAIGYPGPPGLP